MVKTHYIILRPEYTFKPEEELKKMLCTRPLKELYTINPNISLEEKKNDLEFKLRTDGMFYNTELRNAVEQALQQNDSRSIDTLFTGILDKSLEEFHCPSSPDIPYTSSSSILSPLAYLPTPTSTISLSHSDSKEYHPSDSESYTHPYYVKGHISLNPSLSPSNEFIGNIQLKYPMSLSPSLDRMSSPLTDETNSTIHSPNGILEKQVNGDDQKEDESKGEGDDQKEDEEKIKQLENVLKTFDINRFGKIQEHTITNRNVENLKNTLEDVEHHVPNTDKTIQRAHTFLEKIYNILTNKLKDSMKSFQNMLKTSWMKRKRPEEKVVKVVYEKMIENMENYMKIVPKDNQDTKLVKKAQLKPNLRLQLYLAENNATQPRLASLQIALDQYKDEFKKKIGTPLVKDAQTFLDKHKLEKSNLYKQLFENLQDAFHQFSNKYSEIMKDKSDSKIRFNELNTALKKYKDYVPPDKQDKNLIRRVQKTIDDSVQSLTKYLEQIQKQVQSQLKNYQRTKDIESLKFVPPLKIQLSKYTTILPLHLQEEKLVNDLLALADEIKSIKAKERKKTPSSIGQTPSNDDGIPPPPEDENDDGIPPPPPIEEKKEDTSSKEIPPSTIETTDDDEEKPLPPSTIETTDRQTLSNKIKENLEKLGKMIPTNTGIVKEYNQLSTQEEKTNLLRRNSAELVFFVPPNEGDDDFRALTSQRLKDIEQTLRDIHKEAEQTNKKTEIYMILNTLIGIADKIQDFVPVIKNEIGGQIYDIVMLIQNKPVDKELLESLPSSRGSSPLVLPNKLSMELYNSPKSSPFYEFSPELRNALSPELSTELTTMFEIRRKKINKYVKKYHESSSRELSPKEQKPSLEVVSSNKEVLDKVEEMLKNYLETYLYSLFEKTSNNRVEMKEQIKKRFPSIHLSIEYAILIKLYQVFTKSMNVEKYLNELSRKVYNTHIINHIKYLWEIIQTLRTKINLKEGFTWKDTLIKYKSTYYKIREENILTKNLPNEILYHEGVLFAHPTSWYLFHEHSTVSLLDKWLENWGTRLPRDEEVKSENLVRFETDIYRDLWFLPYKGILQPKVLSTLPKLNIPQEERTYHLHSFILDTENLRSRELENNIFSLTYTWFLYILWQYYKPFMSSEPKYKNFQTLLDGLFISTIEGSYTSLNDVADYVDKNIITFGEEKSNSDSQLTNNILAFFQWIITCINTRTFREFSPISSWENPRDFVDMLNAYEQINNENRHPFMYIILAELFVIIHYDDEENDVDEDEDDEMSHLKSWGRRFAFFNVLLDDLNKNTDKNTDKINQIENLVNKWEHLN